MIVRKHDTGYHFWGDTETGLTMRWGVTVDENPMLAPWPELADISISNYCTKGCSFCYRDSTKEGELMSLKDYETVLDAMHDKNWGSVFQVALGGGEPLEHPDLIEILKATVKRGIIPNLTTNGVHVTYEAAKKMKPLIGAVAVSIDDFSSFDWKAVKILIESGIKTNLHYVLSNESILDAISLLKGKYNNYLEGINAVIFLTYKPKGRAVSKKCLKSDEKLSDFLSLVNQNQCSTRIGFDACIIHKNSIFFL